MTDLNITRVAEGDEKAFAQFYQLYYRQLHAYIYRHVRNRSEADEVLQKVFLRVWLNRDKLPEIRSIKAWLARIAAREYLRFLEQRLKYQQKFSASQVEECMETSSIPSSHQLDFKDLNKAIEYSVNRLSPQRKEVFLLSRQKALSVSEIAQRMQLSPQTVKNTLGAALREVRNYLEQEGYLLSNGAVFGLCYLFLK